MKQTDVNPKNERILQATAQKWPHIRVLLGIKMMQADVCSSRWGEMRANAIILR
jgi:hypothetical protein